MALLVTLVFTLGKPWLLPLFTALHSVLALAERYYAWICLLPLVSVCDYKLDVMFLVSGKTATMQYAMVDVPALIILPFRSRITGLGNYVLCMAFNDFS